MPSAFLFKGVGNNLVTLDEWSRLHLGRVTLAGFVPDSKVNQRQARALVLRLAHLGYTERAAENLLGSCPPQLMTVEYSDFVSESVLPAGSLGDILRLVLLHRVLPRGTVAGYLGDELLQFCLDLGLFRETESGVQSLVSGFWCCGLFIWTDAWIHAAVWPSEPRFTDRVMYVGPDSLGLACLVPSERPGRTTRALDLCTGSGVVALAAASLGMDVVGVDINPRAVRFAAFNAAGNGITNATFLQSDLYESVANETFSLVLANPPFVPCPEGGDVLLYRDGGPSGQDVLQRIVHGAPQHLEPGGALLIVGDFVDLPSFPSRVRQWWGERRSFVLVLEEQTIPNVEYAVGHSVGVEPERRSAAASRLHAHLLAADIRTIHFGYLVVAADVSVGEGSLVRQLAAPVVRQLHETTAALLASWNQLTSGIPGSLAVSVCRGLGLSIRIQSAGDVVGRLESRVSVWVEDDPVLSDFDLCAKGYSLVSAIMRGPLSWQEIVESDWSSPARDLLAAGFLRICHSGEGSETVIGRDSIKVS